MQLKLNRVLIDLEHGICEACPKFHAFEAKRRSIQVVKYSVES